MTEQTIEIPKFQSEKIRLSVHKKPACVVEFEVEAFQPLAQAARKVATKRVSKEISLPGFRKGKVPESMVVKNYSKEIDKEYEQALSDLSLQESFTLSKIFPLNKDSRVTYKMNSISPHGALLTLSFEVPPIIPEINPAACTIQPVKRPEVNEEKIQETIRQIQFFFAKWESVQDRPVALGDYVLLDVEDAETTPPTLIFQGTRFEVTEKSMAEWMRQAVIGKMRGEQIEAISQPDADASEEDRQTLTEKKVSIRIIAHDTAELPSLDNNLLTLLGVSSSEELYDKITHLLNKQAEEHVLAKEREQVTSFLLNDCTFELPKSLIQKEAQTRLEHLSSDKEFVDYWEGLDKEKRQELMQTILTQSEKAVRLFYLCRALLAQTKTEISPSDIKESPTSLLEMLIAPHKNHPNPHNPQAEHAEAFARLVLEKAEDVILKGATRSS